jgi:CheY-like chemotaxis protein
MSAVLIADDNAASRELLCEILERAGFKIIEATNGADALAKLESNTVDVVLLDIHMPVLDGFEVLRRIRQNSRFAPLPVAAVSASAMPGDEERAAEVGFDAYLAKPYAPATVIALVRKLIGGTKAA